MFLVRYQVFDSIILLIYVNYAKFSVNGSKISVKTAKGRFRIFNET